MTILIGFILSFALGTWFGTVLTIRGPFTLQVPVSAWTSRNQIRYTAPKTIESLLEKKVPTLTSK